MAKIVLTEKQFKDYMRILRENEKKKNLVNKLIRESMEGENPVGHASPEADPEGLLDGVTEIAGYERCRTDLFIVFDKHNTKSLDGVVRVLRATKENEEEITKYYSEMGGKYWCVFGSVNVIFNFDYDTGENKTRKVLQLYLS